MRVAIIFSLFVLILACNNTSETIGQETNVSEPVSKSDPNSVAEMISADNPDAESPDIRIKVAGAQAGMASLIGFFTDQRYRADSTKVDASGRLNFKREKPYKSGLYFVLLPGEASFQFLVDVDQTFSMEANFGDLLGSMKVEGSLDNELLYRSLQFEREQRAKFDANAAQRKQIPQSDPRHQKLIEEREQMIAIRKAYLEDLFDQNPNTFFVKYKRGGQNPEIPDVRKPNGTVDKAKQVYLYRTRFWDNVDFADERLLYTPMITNKLKRYIDELTPQNPDSIKSAASFLVDRVLDYPPYFKYFANWITLHYDPEKTSLMDPQAVYVHMVQNYFTNERAFWSDSVEIYGLQQRAFEMAASLVGKKAPNVTAKDPTGKPRTLYDLKAPYIVIYMYNPECEHCATETPKLVNFYRQWKNNGVDIFGIAVDTDDAKWKAYIAQNRMEWTNVFDPTNVAIYAKYYVDITPEIYVLNPDRTIIAKNLKVSQIAEVIQRDQNRG